MKIESVRLWKNKIYAVRFENGKGLYLHTDIVLQYALREGCDLSMQQIAEIRQAAADRRTYEYALHLLDRRGYSYKELYDKLMQAEKADEQATVKALRRLVEYGLLNDTRYAQQLAEQYVVNRKFGLRRAAAEMRQHGLSAHDIEDALAAYADAEDASERLRTLLEKKYAKKLADRDDRHARELVIAALIRRGFDYKEIKYALEDYDAAQEDWES